MDTVRAVSALITCSASLLALASGCHHRTTGNDVDRGEDEGTGEDEDEDLARPNYWRAQVQIDGHGSVTSTVGRLACNDDATGPHGTCGPVLFRFDELHPPLLRATGAPGWRLDHWSASIREPDGTTRPRQGAMPDGRLYIDGFGYRDTGELELVTAVFVIAPPGHDDLVTDRAETPRP